MLVLIFVLIYLIVKTACKKCCPESRAGIVPQSSCSKTQMFLRYKSNPKSKSGSPKPGKQGGSKFPGS